MVIRALPDMNSLSGMYMLMKGDDESLYASPSFDVGTTDGEVSGVPGI